MAQTFPDVPSTDQLVNSRGKFVDRTDALRSQFSGTGFPAEAVVGQIVVRTDEGKAYICTNATGPVFTEYVSWLLANVAGVVSYTNVQNVAGSRLLGNPTGVAGAPSEISLGASLSFTGSTLGVATNGITNAMLRQSVAVSVIGRASGTTGDVADIQAGANDRVLRRVSNALDFGQLTAGMFPNAIITNAMLRNSAALSVLGRSANSVGAPADIAAGADGQVLRRASSVLGFGTLISTSFADNTIASSRVAFGATQRLTGRNTAAAGAGEEVTVSQVLDWQGSTRGMIPVRGAATWAGLAVGSNGQFLKSNGTDPSWAAITQADVSGLTTGSSPQFAELNVGHATDTTITRVLAGVAAVEGKPLARVNSGAQANTGLITWGTAAPGTLHEGEIYLRHA